MLTSLPSGLLLGESCLLTLLAFQIAATVAKNIIDFSYTYWIFKIINEDGVSSQPS